MKKYFVEIAFYTNSESSKFRKKIKGDNIKQFKTRIAKFIYRIFYKAHGLFPLNNPTKCQIRCKAMSDEERRLEEMEIRQFIKGLLQ